MDKVYKNRKIWTKQPYDSIVLEPLVDLSN